ncbi:hypothetical protein QNI19_22850 [Cytophagaceae bacterium DM2B3-1]|uniref:Uncharacterized protein n=2 Tax=Xanthocytophaga flava TaxID=3048013 RepID=A0AAE3UB71_9BACT|nr:hypothetical protein [Xanthocytophaga flavus]MDJ1483469.1 hypothetical protein [Xanthocytophaga flavus]MDJ1495793.1 hypothetical protein [Xanthocytophaga flavus]
MNRSLKIGFGIILYTVFFTSEVQAQLVRVPTKAETRSKQKEYSGKKGEKATRSSQPAPSNNAMGKRMFRQSVQRNSDKRAMLVPVRRPQDATDVNNPRSLNLNKQPAEIPLRSKNPMGMAMYKRSLKANSKAKGMLVPGPAYREKMMEKRNAEFSGFRGENRTLAKPYREKMYKKRAEDFNNFRGENRTLAMPYRKKMYKKRAEDLSSYRGGHTLRIEYRKKMYKKKSKELSSYKGDIVVRKRPKGTYPNLKYRGGYKNSSFEKKEKYRKKILKRMGKKKYVPSYMKKKDEKPRYDSRESEIWDKPR